MPDLRPDPQQRDIKQDAALEGANQTAEEVSNEARGHKANLSNPNTSEESKEHSKEALKDLGGEKAFYSKDSKWDKWRIVKDGGQFELGWCGNCSSGP